MRAKLTLWISWSAPAHATVTVASHGSSESAMVATERTIKARYATAQRKGKKGIPEHHLGVAGEDLDDTEEEVDELAVDEEEEPRHGPFSRERYRTPHAPKPIREGAHGHVDPPYKRTAKD